MYYITNDFQHQDARRCFNKAKLVAEDAFYSVRGLPRVQKSVDIVSFRPVQQNTPVSIQMIIINIASLYR